SDAQQLEQRLKALMGKPGGLTARQASARAVATSNELKASEADVKSAAADKDQAEVGYLPRVTLTARYTRLSEIDTQSLGTLVATTQPGPVAAGQPLIGVDLSFPQILDQYLLQANVTVPLTDYFLRTNHANRAAGHNLQAAKYRQQVTKRSAALQAQLAYYGWAQSTLAEVVAEQTLEQAQAHYKVAEAARKADTLTRAELMRFDAQVANAELLLERARSGKEINADALRTLLHDPEDEAYSIGEELLTPLPPLKRSKTSELQRRAQRSRPEFKALSESARAISSQRKAVKASTLPRLDAFGNAYYANPHQRVFPQQDKWTASWDAGLQLTYVINDLPTANASARALDAKQAGV
ncbi:MAG: TolC family protein, partial [Myxococcales bacterium]|nr:TolC family protein [Myxococcales bacterium]